MKGIYVYSTNDKDYMASGEAKKVLSQVKTFRNAGVEMCFVDVVLDRKIDKVLYRMPFRGVYSRDIIRKCEKEAVDSEFVFIRKNIFDRSYYMLLRAIRKVNPSIKVIVEIPSYPYFQEWNRVIDKPFIWKEKRIIPKVTREHLVDYYLTLTDDTEIYGIPAIEIDNCVLLEEYTPKKKLQNPEEVHLIGVALLAKWHGFDRVIRGMDEYYKKNGDKCVKVIFHIVGDGPERYNLQKLSEQCSLEKFVIFEGRQKGTELDHLYDISDVGIGSLGLFRKGIVTAKSLKLREYCAKGIPFIKGGGDPSFDDYLYCLSFSNDDKPIDISAVVNWARKTDYDLAVKSMREYAASNLDWEKYIRKVMNKVYD
jgi:hypothetical protein